jgi:hypothetical protein
MSGSRRIAALAAAAALAAPAAAAAQATTLARGAPSVSSTPPVPLAESAPEAGASSVNVADTRRAVAAGGLPSTGSDPRMLFLCGVALTLLGVGLRLRTADADLY